jgi:hypothetical protein
MDVLPSPAGRLAGPGRAAPEDVTARVVAAAVCAPSMHDTQAWWFCACGQENSLHADISRQLMVADPAARHLRPARSGPALAYRCRR